MDFQTELNIPEGSVIMGAVVVVQYFTEEGETRYSIRTQGGLNISTYLGLTVMAQQDLMDWNRSNGG